MLYSALGNKRRPTNENMGNENSRLPLPTPSSSTHVRGSSDHSPTTSSNGTEDINPLNQVTITEMTNHLIGGHKFRTSISKKRFPSHPISTVTNFSWKRSKDEEPEGLFDFDPSPTSRFRAEHRLVCGLFGKYKSPMHETLLAGGRVLDIGTGTGTWGLEMAKDYPKSDIYGLDVVNMLNEVEHLPKNFRFIQADVLQPLPFPDNYFDFVYARLMVAAIPKTKWDFVVSEYLRVTKRRGYIELVEADGEISSLGPNHDRIQSYFLSSFENENLETRAGSHLSHVLENFQDLVFVQSNYKTTGISWGPYADITRHIFQSVLINLRPALQELMGIPSEEAYEVYVRLCMEECKAFNTTVDVFYATAQKSALAR